MCLHVVQGAAFNAIVECLDAGNAVWIAVGGARELNPYIRKIHTGAARIALQAAQKDYEVVLVPVHMAFEAHCQFNSAVLVELGKPIRVGSGLDPDSEHGRERVKQLMAELRASLLPLTNWIPANLNDWGKKGRRGSGQTRLAVSEWHQIRVIDTLVCLDAARKGPCEGRSPLPWPLRVQRVRAAAQQLSEARPGEALALAFEKASHTLCSVVAQQGTVLFRGPAGTYWDMPVALKAMPRSNPTEVSSNLTLAALRNFSDGPLRHIAPSESSRLTVHDATASGRDCVLHLAEEATNFVDLLECMQWHLHVDAQIRS